MTKSRILIGVLVLALTLGAAALLVPGTVPNADAQGSVKPAAACPNPGVYTGTSTTGSLQGALDNAIAAAEACAGCCDFLVTWRLVEVDGRRGGFAGFNDVNVTINASW
jgi:hypothetical protein